MPDNSPYHDGHGDQGDSQHKKNAIAYDNREFRESDASDIFKQAERFYLWAFEYLNKK